jgi:hypothetical protein
MQKIVSILLIIINSHFAFSQSKKQYPYYNNIPTKNGIQQYIDRNKSNILNLVENFIGDSIRSYHIKTDNLSEYMDYDSLEAGRFYPEDEIIITNELKYYDYELGLVPKWKQKEFNSNTKFVKGVLIHEFTHVYIYQFIYDCLENNIPIFHDYINFNMFPGIRTYYSSEFIEEGICEYMVMKLREGIFRDYKFECNSKATESDIREFLLVQNTYGIKYQYSRAFVERIFENNSFKKALLIIFTCRPPSYEELLCPDLYYQRLMKQAENYPAMRQ